MSLIHSPEIDQEDSLSTYPTTVVWQFNSSRRHTLPPTLARGRVPVGILPPVTHVLGLAKLLLITHTLTGLVVEPAGLEAGQGRDVETFAAALAVLLQNHILVLSSWFSVDQLSFYHHFHLLLSNFCGCAGMRAAHPAAVALAPLKMHGVGLLVT